MIDIIKINKSKPGKKSTTHSNLSFTNIRAIRTSSSSVGFFPLQCSQDNLALCETNLCSFVTTIEFSVPR